MIDPLHAPAAAPDAKPKDDPAKVRDAARQFEALLLAQLLKGMRDSGGWLGSGDDEAGSAAMEFGEEMLAQSLAGSGGVGIATLVADGLARQRTTSDDHPRQAPQALQP